MVQICRPDKSLLDVFEKRQRGEMIKTLLV